MTIRSIVALTAVLGFPLAACSESPTAQSRTPILAALAVVDSAGGGGGRTLLYRSDSLSRSAYASWFDGTLYYYVSVTESQMPGTRTAFLGYGAYTPWYQTAFYGYGTIPASDVTGSGIGDLRVRTNTAGNPGFFVYNDSGGPVDITFRQVPGGGFRYQRTWRNEWPPLLFIGNARDLGRQATATGTFAWRTIPDSVQASMYQAMAHSEVFLMPGF